MENRIDPYVKRNPNRLKVSSQLVRFVQTRNVRCVAGQVKNNLASEYGFWLGALLHYETNKLIVSTPPCFKTKKHALEFMEELVLQIRTHRTGPGTILSIN